MVARLVVAGFCELGVATTAEPASMSVEQLREHADTALYAAKNQGRNRVCGNDLAA